MTQTRLLIWMRYTFAESQSTVLLKKTLLLNHTKIITDI